MIILAAGESARMGQPKQLLAVADTQLLNFCLRRALQVSVEQVLVVLGYQAAEIQDQIEDTRVKTVINKGWSSGMGSSLAVGLKRALQRQPHLDQVLISLGDLPLLDTSHFEKLLTNAQNHSESIIAMRYATTRGVPVLFKKKHFDALLALDGEIGAKSLLNENADDVFWVEAEVPYADVDTPEDYHRILRILERP